ncbi:carbohydrate ABC transporter permease [Acidipropionibacterium timonense]|uniref:carbohydrate ABC transporter permease n=1 Tax=Acidipropionibacterium timonense TaxID=2161818 RepID=UPI00102F4B43|nr:sugar ABC transporter permease [Acidipropionibacterium timonense]
MSVTRTRQMPTPRRTIGQRWSTTEVKVAPYLYVAPFFIVFLIVGMFPLLYTGYLSFRKWNLIRGDLGPAGWSNYAYVLDQARFWKGLGNTFSIFLLSSVPQVIAAVLIAAVLNANLRAKTFWRMGVLVPYVVAPVAVSLIFGQLFADGSGAINTLLTTMGLHPIAWHGGGIWPHIAIASMVNFRWTGYNSLIFLAAMQAIPQDIYEAAVVDCANRVQTFLRVTIPMLRPTMIFVVITSTIGGLQIFDEPRMFDNIGMGGADRQWMTLTMYLYELGWGSQHNLGRSAAVAWLLFLVVVLIALLNFALTRRISSTGSTTGHRRGGHR